FDAERHVLRPPQRRGVGFLFQDYALFPHLTVAGNVGYALARLAGPERRRRIVELLAAFGLTGLDDRYPHQVSGGQQQRVALARPAGLAVARIVGTETVQPGQIVAVVDGLATIQVGRAKVAAVAPATPEREVFVCIRGEDVALQRGEVGDTSPRNRLAGVVDS